MTQHSASSNPTRTQRAAMPGSSLIYPLDSIIERIELDKLFPACQPLEIELGSGDSSFLVACAARHPERNFIGVERLLGRIRKLDRKGRQAGLGNLRGVRIESAYFLQYLLPPRSASAVHIYFPDPWPKRKHQRHRLINDPFARVVQTALVPGGRIFIRTDDPAYFEQIRRVFETSPAFCAEETPRELAELLTDFERDFLARGIKTLRAAYRSRPHSAPTTDEHGFQVSETLKTKPGPLTDW